MGNSAIYMAMFNSYVSLPEVNVDSYPSIIPSSRYHPYLRKYIKP